MEIAIVTDEISDDPQTSIELGLAWGVGVYELRGYGTERVPLFTPFQKRRIEELLDQYQVRIAAILPGLFKCANPLAPREHFPSNIIDQALYEKWRGPRNVVAYHLPAILPMTADREADFDAYGRYLEWLIGENIEQEQTYVRHPLLTVEDKESELIKQALVEAE